VRHPRVVAGVVLIAALAAVAVPGSALSEPPSSSPIIDPTDLSAVHFDGGPGPAMTMLTPRLPYPLDSYRDFATDAPNLAALAEPPVRPSHRTATAGPGIAPAVASRWHDDHDVSWYGPGFYGGRTACGQAYTTTILGVANRTLPCGTLVTFRNPDNGRTITVPVIDRGPYVSGRQWDLSGAVCLALGHCYTGEILWRLA
jgi:hypothetical protein